MPPYHNMSLDREAAMDLRRASTVTTIFVEGILRGGNQSSALI